MSSIEKKQFLRYRECQLDGVVNTLTRSADHFADHEMYATEFSDFTTRLEACLREIKSIRSAIGDKADELGGA